MNSDDDLSPEAFDDLPRATGRGQRSPAARLVGCLVRGPLGCLAFGLGAFVVCALASPYVLARMVPGLAAESFSGNRGSLEVGAVEFGWFSRQRVDGVALRDPDRAPVVRGSASFPPLGALLVGGFDDLGRTEVELEVDLVTGLDGRTNLQRALEGRTVRLGGEENESEVVLDPGDSGAWRRVFEKRGELVVRVTRLTYSDRRPGAPAESVEVRDLVLHGKLEPGRSARLTGTGRLVSPEEGEFTLEVDLGDTAAAARGAALTPSLVLRADPVPVRLVDALAGQGGLLVELFGERATLTVDGSAKLDGPSTTGAFALRLEAPHADATVDLALDAAGVTGADAVVAAWSPTDAALAQLAGARLPEGVRWTAAGSEPVTLRVTDLALPLPNGWLDSPGALDPATLLADLAFAIDAELGDWRLDGAALERPVELSGLSLSGRLRPGEPLAVDLTGRGGGAPLGASLLVHEPAALATGAATGTRVARLEVTSGAPAALLPAGLVPEERAALVAALLDGPLALAVDVGRDAEDAGRRTAGAMLDVGPLALRAHALLDAERVRFVDGVEEAGGDARPTRLELTLTPALERALLGPEGLGAHGVELGDRRLALALDATVPFAERVGDDGAAERGPSLAGASFRLRSLALPDASWLAPSGERLRAGGLALEAQAGAGSPVVVELRADDLAGGRARAGATLPALARLAEGGELPPVDLAVSVERLPTARADALAGSRGLLRDLLGETIGVSVDARDVVGTERGELALEFTSDLATAGLAARLAGGELVAVEDRPARVAFSLTPLASERVVGSLVPLVGRVEPASPDDRATLELTEFRLPLDGDLAKLDALGSLDLGPVRYQLAPFLGDALAGLATEAKEAKDLGPYAFAIRDGVVRYEALPVSIEGDVYTFSGSIDLASGALALGTALPVARLGGDVGKVAKQALPAGTTVPVGVGGTLSKPKLDVELGDAVESAAEQALEELTTKGLRDLLKGLGGG